MTMKNDAKFEEKLTWGIRWILTRALESLKNFHFNVPLLSKVYIVWAKNYRGVIFYETEEGYQIWRGIDLSFKNWHKEFDNFFFFFYKICPTKVPTNKTVNNELKKLKNSNTLTQQDKTSLFGLLI